MHKLKKGHDHLHPCLTLHRAPTSIMSLSMSCRLLVFKRGTCRHARPWVPCSTCRSQTIFNQACLSWDPEKTTSFLIKRCHFMVCGHFLLSKQSYITGATINASPCPLHAQCLTMSFACTINASPCPLHAQWICRSRLSAWQPMIKKTRL